MLIRKDWLDHTRRGKTPPEEAPLPETSTDATSSLLPAAQIEEALRNPRTMPRVPPELIDSETLWLARVVYTESKRLEEQELVAWVVRNRVETAYRGKRTYQDVVLDAYQFSAFNPNSRKRRYYSSLDVDTQARGWQRTLSLAYYVRHAQAHLRPFSDRTRHFYSEVAMGGDEHPPWVRGIQPITPNRPVKLIAERFRFYEGVM
ncbi:MAG: hypothetical protein ACE5G0_00475 [Rhodothermales bacterium]